MKENVGNVVLDLTYYAGEDVYSDGAIEDEIFDIVKNHAPEEFPKIIEEKKSWPVFYHLSPYRTNIIDWLPFKKTDRVLEIGSGCGAITGRLAQRCGHVTCVDLSKKRSMINALRNADKDNITIMVGNFKDIEPHLATDYDYVLLIGVFEYGQAYIGGKTPYEDFMRLCNKHRSSNGRLIIAIENKFGLKYWAGCREDHLGSFYSGLEGYREGGSARTFTRDGLEKIIKKVGIGNYAFYYPYPDYKFMTTIFSDRYLPQKGELCNNLRNFDRDRMINFDEKQVFDQILEEGQFPLFSNSYLVVIGKTPEAVYSKFSNDRDETWAIRTSIYEDVFGQLHVEKVPASNKAMTHIRNTAKAYELLAERYQGTKIVIDPCILVDPKNQLQNRNGRFYMSQGLSLAYCTGKTLEEALDECLTNGDMNAFKTLVQEYMKWLSYGESDKCSNIDFIFPNIIIDGEKWQVIDYEWTFEKLIPAKEIAFRAFYNYLLGSEVRQQCKKYLYSEVLKLKEQDMEAYIRDEREFQKYITGERASVADMRELIGFRAFDTKEMQKYFLAQSQKLMCQVFFDQGNGFSEEGSIRCRDGFVSPTRFEKEIILPKGTNSVRIDPSEFPCICKIVKITADKYSFSNKNIATNGEWLTDTEILFTTTDPNFTIESRQADKVCVIFEITELSAGAAASLLANLSGKETKQRKRFF